MKIKENDNFPDVDVYQLSTDGPVTVKTSELFSGKKILLVAVPGAFTPTCSQQHLPGYIKLSEEFLGKGIEKIFFASINDPFVMKAWVESHGKNLIECISDTEGKLIDSLGSELDLSVIGLGKRFSRFAMIVDDGVIIKIFDENGGGLEKSEAENVLKNI